jgi:hypothetical protein
MTPDYQHISPVDLRDYIKSLGWTQLEEGVKDGLYVLSNPAHHFRQLIFPMDSVAPDYGEAVQIAMEKLAFIENRPIESILSQLDESNDDTIRFKVVDTRHDDNYIPLAYAVNAVAGVKDMLLAAASTVLKPQVHHARLSRAEAQQLIEKVRFRQTEKGSFVIKVSAPLTAADNQTDIFGVQATPLIRLTTLTVCKSLDKMVRAIQSDHIGQLIDETKASPAPDLSANLCTALASFQEPHGDYDLYVDFSWASALRPPIGTQTAIKVQRDYFPRIQDIARELRKNAPGQDEETFMATVEHLAGILDTDGRRAGEVILNLYKDGETIRARTYLAADQYIDADKAHMTSGTFIKVAGVLQPGYQPRNLVNIRTFQIIER